MSASLPFSLLAPLSPLFLTQALKHSPSKRRTTFKGRAASTSDSGASEQFRPVALQDVSRLSSVDDKDSGLSSRKILYETSL